MPLSTEPNARAGYVWDVGTLAWVAAQQATITTGSLNVNVGTPNVKVLNDLIPVAYDYMALTYTGDDLTKVEYYTGGAGGTKVATLTMTYSLGILQTVTRT